MLNLRTVDERSTSLGATGRTTISTSRPAGVVRTVVTRGVASLASTGIITQSHERRTGVTTAAACRTAIIFVACVILGFFADLGRGFGSWLYIYSYIKQGIMSLWNASTIQLQCFMA